MVTDFHLTPVLIWHLFSLESYPTLPCGENPANKLFQFPHHHTVRQQVQSLPCRRTVSFLLQTAYFAAFLPAMRPNTMMSAIASLPKRFLPRTPPVTSPAAYKPGITLPSVFMTCAWLLILTPPIVWCTAGTAFKI